MKSFLFALISVAVISFVLSAVITGFGRWVKRLPAIEASSLKLKPARCNVIQTCEGDQQCNEGMCCAVTLWLRSLRVCTLLGSEEDDCHPQSRRVPYLGKRMHNTCPCLPGLRCVKFEEKQYKCSP
ncbi:prokineticin-2 [Rhinoraja longicauda]